MLELRNVNKTYVSSKKNKVEALKEVNLEFKTKGLNFILGASGSGKSTLLNLIGGIDKPTSGEILINGNKVGEKELPLDEYRGNYISFIFQDFNLLPNLTIYDNIGIVYGKNEEGIKERIEKILKAVGLEGYENRYPNELSGGQIQRVAIARALAKESSIILADEPTGNLNKENSENVCDILKQISKEKLVIVVSHNEELANKYGDRIIRIEDGKIIKDEELNKIEITEIKFKENVHKFSNKNIIKLAIKNIFEKKVRFIISILSIIISFSILSLSLSVAFFDRPYVDSINIKNNNINKYVIEGTKAKDPNAVDNIEQVRFNRSMAEEIEKTNGLEYIRNGVIKSINQVISMGYELYPNYREIDDESIILPDYELYLSVENNNLHYISNDEVVKKKELKFDDIDKYYIYTDDKYYIAGVYKTFRYENLDNENIYNQDKEDSSKAFGNRSEEIIFYTSGGKYDTNLTIKTALGKDKDKYRFVTEYKKLRKRSPTIIFMNIYGPRNIEYFNDTNYGELSLDLYPKDNEIYISLSIYNEIFGEKHSLEYYIGYSREKVINSPTYINEIINIEFSENKKDGSPGKSIQLNNLVIKGIIIDDVSNDSILVSPSVKAKISDFMIDQSMVIKTSSVDNQYKFLKSIYKKYGLYANYCYTTKLKLLNDNLDTARLIFKVLMPITIILIVLINTIVISQIVKAKDKENGILRAIGIKKNSILNIYLIQSIIMIIISFILSLVISQIFLHLTNNSFIGEYSKTFTIILFRWQYGVIIIAITVLANLIISYGSLHRAISKNPIDVIRLR